MEGHDQGLVALLKDLPPVDVAFAYGSGVFTQPALDGASDPQKLPPMLDFILAARDPKEWHTENIARNREHYSFLARFGGSTVASVASRLGAGVHFNTLVPWQDKLIKYGVIRTLDLVQDVINWEALYIAGRLQKPVHFLADEAGITDVNALNLRAALCAALLQLPPTFSEDELWRKVCGLSYGGDIRVAVSAEDPRKVEKIAVGSKGKLREIYAPSIRQLAVAGLVRPPPAGGAGEPDAEADCSEALWTQEDSTDGLVQLVSSLPSGVLSRLGAMCGTRLAPHDPWALGDPQGPETAVARAAVQRWGVDSGRFVQRAISSIVSSSSRRQAVSGLLAAGGGNSLRYVSHKLSKGLGWG